MARGPATSLLRIYASKKDMSKVRALLLNQYLSSFGKYDRSESQNPPFRPAFGVPNRPFSTSLINLARSKFPSQTPKCSGFETLVAKPFSSIVEDGNDDSVSSSALVDSDCEYDADVGKAIEFEHVNDNPACDSENSDKGVNMIESEDVNGGAHSGKSVGYKHVMHRNPVELYQELRNAEKGVKLRRSDWDTLQEIFRYLKRSGWASDQALAIYIGKAFFPTAVHNFQCFCFKRLSADIAGYVVSLGPSDAAVKFLFPIFVEFCLEEFPNEIKQFRSMIESADLTKPHTWFPFARAMKRKIIYHCGPTNSGKTYNALQRFMEAKKGIYCSPLRLLAMEVFDKVNANGVYCSLLTGQEKKYVPFSNHVACTVEMVSTDELYDVAIIDEIQMVADPYRGFAWTRALLGLKADEIHLCGDPSVLNIVRKICADTGDELHEQHYERFKPLVVEAKTLLGDLKNVRSGDCVVAFSRREIFEIKLAIEKQTKHRCCVIYGALPPETRRQQATLFNDKDNEYDVLVASDAVGMGLNLNIRRVVFYGLSKYNGDRTVPIPASQVKQIAGRAGRRGSCYPDGLTTTLHLDDLDYLIECLKQPFDDIKKVGLFPFFEQVELFAGQLPNVTFCQLLEKFGENCRLDGSYFLCRHDHIKKIANMLEKVPELSLEDRFNFCFAPVNIRDPKAMYHLLRFASAYGQKVPVNIAMGMPKGFARNDKELLDLETKHQVLSMYLWLSQHMKADTFPYKKKAEVMATDIAELLGQSLTNANWKPESRWTGKPKPQEKEKEDAYDRPRSLIKLYNKRRNDKSLKQEHSEKITAW
ncbi:DExH-box ATP-dependent RNA helicase DExH18, mitochondrial isoform X1 [Ziziphus jujuba]|uniref:RNA helicase n=1 Tax=Ziziphus jujuba TaxID=326968 RepID=A0A6P3ZLB1_ZIZJJ|nr:DExH-box ATP-dependent RNA helicase DExH18, mitochondrial isoform X1 [Ziziphus jujuba]XP_048327720.2 DExH-box ATP-dependent RNA helicase DExH18, mitochondrial isoform X1 [Ziziphus jujuba]XP_060672459.1 DExH-box ATP-dependent RNA helicase DExH18, mitochondrial isoform X1 [Ziziphus jujuba]